MNISEMYVSGGFSSTKTIYVSRRISAVQMMPEYDSGSELGLVSQLAPGTELQVCGEGFNDRTVKVRTNNVYYFVFRDDLETEKTLAAAG